MTNAATRSASASKAALIAALSYLFLTWILFFIGPYDWPLESLWPVILYVPLIFAVLGISHLSALKREAKHVPFPHVRSIIIFGGLAAVILLIPSAQIYSGRWPWQVMEALADQKEAYRSLRDALESSEGSRGPIVLARSIAAPFIYAVLPLGVIYWKQLNTLQRSLVVATVLSNVIFSVLRGTTRELADMLVIAGSAFLVGAVRNKRRSFLVAHWGKVLIGVVLVIGVFSALISRAQARLGAVTIACAGDSGVCANLTTGFYGRLSDSAAFGATMITGYLSQGYYGMALAMKLPFLSTWGIGHSSAFDSLYRAFTNDPTLYQRSYTYRLRELGWSDEYQWSSMLTWLANDVSFWGVPFIIALIGLGWGASWADATKGRDDRAAVLFCVFMSMIFYLPANNQMAAVLENYTVVIFWLFSWAFSRQRAVTIQP